MNSARKRLIVGAALTGIGIGLLASPDESGAQGGGQIEGCHWSDIAGYWQYPDLSPCRGTGEDPTVDGDGLPACANGRVAQPVTRFGTLTYRCEVSK